MKSPKEPRGLLRVRPPKGSFEHRRERPDPALAESIEHFWWVRWTLSAPYLTETLPHPAVHVVFERDDAGARARIGGVHRGRWTRELQGVGRSPARFARDNRIEPAGDARAHQRMQVALRPGSRRSSP